jgi:glycogen debranching enzyme
VSLPERAWRRLESAILEFQGRPIGLSAANDPETAGLQYDRCFVRDFSVCAPALLLGGREDVVRGFLIQTLRLQETERNLDCLAPAKGLMPASFRPVERAGEATIDADFGEKSIASVTPVDSVLWWLLALRLYRAFTGDRDLHAKEEFQRGIRHIVELVLEARFEMFPTLLVPDGSFMIDRRMGVYGYPLEVQSLLFAALRAAAELIEDGGELRSAIARRLRHLSEHIHRYYWLDRERIERLASGGVNQYGLEVANALNVYPETVPSWAAELTSEDSGYFAGNIGPGRIDFRFFAQGNLLAIAAGLASQRQCERLMTLYDEQWARLVTDAPLRICYPAIAGEEWRIVTGADRKNQPWSYHNGGCWPALLYSFVPAALRTGRRDLAEKAVASWEDRLERDRWPEYYEGEHDPQPALRARLNQSWSIGAYLYAKACLEDQRHIDLCCWPNLSADSRQGESAPDRTGV